MPFMLKVSHSWFMQASCIYLSIQVYRVYANSQEFESFRLNETLQTYSDDGKVIIKHGRALKKGEYRVKVFQLLVNEPEVSCNHRRR